MFYINPTKRIERKTGFTDSYHLESETAKLNVGTLVGGWQEFQTVNSVRYFYIIKGMGTAIVRDNDQYNLVGGEFIKAPAHSFCKLDGQLQFVEVTGDTSTTLLETTEGISLNSETHAHFVYIIEGLGNVKMNGQNKLLRDGSFIEIPKDTAFEFKGKAKYLLVTIN